MNIETRTVELEYLELRDDDDGHHLVGIVAPWHSTFDTGDYLEQFARTVFDKSIKERGTRIPLLEQHDRNRHPVGMSMSWENTADGLVADFRLANTSRADESRQLVVDNMVTGLSLAFQPIRNRTETRDGRRHVLRLEGRLDHVGLVTSAAYGEAKVLAVRHYDPDDPQVAPRLAKWRHLLTS